MILDELNCSISIWTIQGFEYKNKQSKHIYERKANSKGNYYKQVLRGVA